MPNNIYNVKQAAKILGLSTNTTYKYLNEGRIKAARGHIRGTFIITAKALENFLGSKLPEDPLREAEGMSTFAEANYKDAEAIIEVTPPSLAIKVTRVIIALCLVFIIVDTITAKDFSPLTQLARVAFISLVFLLSYQFGGFVKR